MGGEKVRIKCPKCGLVQWKSAACHRCGEAFEAPAAQAAPPPAQAAPQEPKVWAQPAQQQPQAQPAQTWAPPNEPPSPSIEVKPAAVAPPQVYPEPHGQPAAGMSDIYAPPTADVGEAGFHGAAVGHFGSITEDMVVTLEQSSRWMGHNARFGYILAVVYILVALAGLGAGSLVSGEAEGGGAVLFGMLLVYGLMAAIVFMVAHHLRGAARSAKQIRDAGNPGMMLADTLQHQAYVWKVTGIISLISLVLIFVSLLLMLGGILTGLAN